MTRFLLPSRNARIGLSFLAALHALQQSTRLSRRSYAVWPRRGVTWSSVTERTGMMLSQYAQMGPCWCSSHSRVSEYAARPVGTEVSVTLGVGAYALPLLRPRERRRGPVGGLAGI